MRSSSSLGTEGYRGITSGTIRSTLNLGASYTFCGCTKPKVKKDPAFDNSLQPTHY